PSDYNDNNKPSDHNNYDVPDDYEAFKKQQKVAPVSLMNAFNGLKAFSDKSSYVLGEHNQNILETDNQNKKAKSEKKDGQKEKVMGVIS
ncbi:7318_t:CDS:2, partial [Gigaspora margarita]